MPRRARLDAAGTLHHVIVRGIEKRRIVNDVVDRENFVQRLGELAAVPSKLHRIDRSSLRLRTSGPAFGTEQTQKVERFAQGS